MPSSLTDEQLNVIVTTLYTIRTDDQAKLGYGALQRALIKDALDAGTGIENYRVAWLRETRLKLISAAQESARRFNETYPHDMISVQDLLDAISSAFHQLKKAALITAGKEGKG